MNKAYTVVEFPEKRIAGLHVQTDMQNAAKDCPALWQAFGPRICTELANCASISKEGHTYGVSIMTDPERFTYWAAIEIGTDDASGKALPKDIQTMTIPAGLYVKCQVENLSQLGEAFTALYMQWPQTQNEYALNMQGLCFELYPMNWQLTDPLEIYASVIKK